MARGWPLPMTGRHTLKNRRDGKFSNWNLIFGTGVGVLKVSASSVVNGFNQRRWPDRGCFCRTDCRSDLLACRPRTGHLFCSALSTPLRVDGCVQKTEKSDLAFGEVRLFYCLHLSTKIYRLWLFCSGLVLNQSRILRYNRFSLNYSKSESVPQ